MNLALQKNQKNSSIVTPAMDMGRVDSLRYQILSMVAGVKYEKAIEELKMYLDSKEEYPKFRQRTQRYIDHCTDLIRAIKTKKHFPGFNSLSKSKQQELTDVVTRHFSELTGILKKIEAIELELRLDDLKSTVWVIKSLVYVLGGIVGVAFLLELTTGGLLQTAYHVVNGGVGDVLDFFKL